MREGCVLSFEVREDILSRTSRIISAINVYPIAHKHFYPINPAILPPKSSASSSNAPELVFWLLINLIRIITLQHFPMAE